MKKITYSLLLFLAIISGTYAQVQIGEGTNELQSLPFEPYYEYSYGQSIYLANEINASGSITAIKWYYSGSTDLENSQELIVYMGHTDKEAFDNSTDFVDPSTLTQVYSGGIFIENPEVPGWVTITLATPFVYDGINNLVIAVDESMEDYDNYDDDFRNTFVSGQRSIYAYSDYVNFDPMNPSSNPGGTADDVSRGTATFVPNIIFEGIQQACPNPTLLGINNLTTVSATLKWSVNTDISQYNVQYGDEGFELGSGTAGNGVANPYPISGLDPQTTYQFYVQAVCGETTSGWSGPYTFTTPCDPIEDFYETFDETQIGEEMPECWSKVVNSGSESAYIKVVNYSSFSGENCIEMYNSGDSNAQIYLVSPNITTFEEMRVKFRAFGSGYTVEVGTMTNPTDPSTFTIIGTPITLTENYLEYYRTVQGASGSFVAIRHGLGGTYRTIYVDNVILEPVPTVAPECVTDLNVTPNESCGNFTNTFEWSAVENADGYKLTIGTTSGAGDVVNNQDLGNVTEFSFTGNHNTTYYYSLVAYNASGDATGCFTDSFDTAPDGCYCESIPNPELIDNDGVTNVQVGLVNFPIELTYTDNTEIETVDLSQGVDANVQITFETGFDYDTHIWIDFNDNYVFESNEKVFSGVAPSTNPVLFNATFPMPENATLGAHRMRIGTADSGQSTPNPCYNDGYGFTMDFFVNIVPAPACLPPTALATNTVLANSANLSWTSGTSTFNVQYGETGFALGDGVVVSGISSNGTTVDELTSSTNYQFYVQTVCDTDSLSPWAGPFSFRTSCDAFGDFEEDFTTDTTIDAPECWSTIVQSTTQSAYVRVYSWSDAVEMYNSDDTSANLILVTPNLTDLPLGTHRIKFKAASYSNSSLIVGTMSDPSVPSSFTPVSTISLSDNGIYADFTVAFTASTHNYVAFKHGVGSSYVSVFVDDVIWEPIPSVVPSCVEEVTVTVDENCGNFATLFEWEAAEYADGYKVSVGTTVGGTDVINNVNIGNVTAVNFTGDFNTTYFYTLTPYNTLGDAVGCVGGTFTTAETGCYCSSVPTSLDGSGITNIQVGDIDYVIEDETYTDNTEQEVASFTQGQEANLQITFETEEYSYDTHVWIDFNDDYVFSASELVFSGESQEESPTTLDATFTVPAGAAPGNHRMRIGTADSGQWEPDPCYSGTYGVTVDFTVNIEVDLGIDDLSGSNFKAYPNPVKDILNLSHNQNISKVEVFNILGQQVIAKTVGATQGQVDMSNLISGTYLVKVTTDNQLKTIKVIKQ